MRGGRLKNVQKSRTPRLKNNKKVPKHQGVFILKKKRKKGVVAFNTEKGQRF